MANSKQKVAPAGGQRRPGKTKFSIPRKEAPPVDGSYLERLFADYNKQAKELEGWSPEVPQESEPVEHQQVTDLPLPPPLSADPASPNALAEAAGSEISEISYTQPPAVTVPFLLKETETVTEVPEEFPPLPPSVPSFATEVTEVRPTDVTGLTTPLTAPHEQPLGDELLLETWKKRHRLSKGEVKVLRVLIRLCREASGDYCYVKVPQLMVDAELKERQTQLVLRSLQELGLVEKVAEYSNADRMGTKYRVFFHAE